MLPKRPVWFWESRSHFRRLIDLRGVALFAPSSGIESMVRCGCIFSVLVVVSGVLLDRQRIVVVFVVFEYPPFS